MAVGSMRLPTGAGISGQHFLLSACNTVVTFLAEETTKGITQLCADAAGGDAHAVLILPTGLRRIQGIQAMTRLCGLAVGYPRPLFWSTSMRHVCAQCIGVNQHSIRHHYGPTELTYWPLPRLSRTGVCAHAHVIHAAGVHI